MSLRALVLVAAAALVGACLPPGRFRCTDDADCRAVVGARCEASHVCSAPDPSCVGTGRRYDRYDDGSGRWAGRCVVAPCERDPVRLVRSGASHACLLRASGTVMCWGANESGQLGDGTTTARSVPTAVVGLSELSDVRDLALGDGHTCVVRGEGDVWCWGRNDAGQLGDGLLVNRATPSQVPQLKQVDELAAGAATSCARTRAGQVFCWGSNAQGELGVGAADPYRVMPGALPNVVGALGLELGAHHGCLVAADRTLRCWGANAVGQLGDGTTTARRAPVTVVDAAGAALGEVVEVAAGSLHTCARTFAGAVACWGFNQAGQLGDGTRATRSTPAPVQLPPGVSVAALRSGAQHVCAIASNEALLCWGGNGAGQLGDGTTSARETPSFISSLAGVVDVALGEGHSCAKTRAGELFCWGDDRAGQLGTGATILRAQPAPVAGLTNVAAIALGADHACAIHGGAVACWGAGASGRLGSGNERDSARPVDVALPAAATSVAAGAEQSCAIVAGSVFCWGRGSSGQLAVGATDSWVPIAPPALTTVDLVTLGRAHGCARSPGRVLCWGVSDEGQAGPPSPSPVPPQVALMVPTAAIAAGGAFTCAIDGASSVSCWGRGDDDELGGEPGGSGVPKTVALPGPATSIATGEAHACASIADGRVFCWGRGNDGQLGAGATIARSVPGARVLGVDGAKIVAAGARHSCAIDSDGAALCWGANASGQLGNGTTVASAAAVRAGSGPYRAIAAGRAHTCALRTDGRVDCWGDDGDGQLGDGARLVAPTPRPVALTCAP